MSNLIHSSYFCPRVYPYNGDILPAQIDRLQAMDATVTLNRERIREIGRDGTVDWRHRIPSTRLTLRQLEYGSMEFYRKLANIADATTSITLNDFKTSMVDICGYKTDDAGSFIGTVWYPKFRTAGFGITIGDPQANIERSFDLIGEDENILEYNNKYFNYIKFTSAAGGAPESFTVNAPSPVEDQDNSGQYLFRVLRVRSGVTTELTFTSGTATGDLWHFAAPSTLTVASTTADVFKVYYSAATFCTTSQSAVFTNNDNSSSGLLADSASIYLYVSSNNYVYELQSVGIDVTFDRRDYYEIGDEDVISRGIADKTVRITLGRILKAYTIEEVLRGVSSTYGRINTRKYRDDITLRVKLYSNSLKTVFNIGFKATSLSPTGFDPSVPLNDYVTRGASLESENLTISTSNATIDAS